jgi:hypothetical protein
MSDQAPERSGFQLCSGFVVDGHGRYPALQRLEIWRLSQILPYPGSNNELSG